MRHLVIGLGSIGKRHYRLLEEAGEEVCGIDKNPVKNEGCGIDFKTADMIWVCTTEDAKEMFVKQGVANGKKVFVEKPYFGDEQVFVACNYRFHPAVKVLKENLHKVGEILYSRIHHSHYLPYQRENWKEYMKDTNIVKDVGWHFVDLALWLFGEGTENAGCHKAWISQGIHEFFFEDRTSIQINHDNEITTNICIDYLRRDKSWGIEIVGKNGTLLLEYRFHPDGDIYHVKSVIDNVNDYFYCATVGKDEMYKNQLDHLLKEFKPNIEEVKEVAKICG